MANREDCMQKINEALELTTPGLSESVTIDTHLVKDGVLDSLDLMNFMFELEHINGAKLHQIDESFDDYRVSRIVDIMLEA